MKTKHEIIDFGDSVPLHFFIYNSVNVEHHWHQSVELLYVLSGSTQVTIKEQVYQLKEDDIIVINSFDIHSLQAENCAIAAFLINITKFEQSLFHNPMRFECNSTIENEIERFTPLKRLLANLIKSNTNDVPYIEVLNKSYAYQLLYLLMTDFGVEQSADYNDLSKNMDRMENILRYIHLNYMNKITLNQLADKSFLTIPYLSKIFKNHIGMNFMDYVTSVRLQHAVEDLSDASLSIEMIAEQNGFPNTRSFVTAFKDKFDVPPSQYRKDYLFTSPKSSPLNKFSEDYLNFTHNNHLERLAQYLEKENAIKTIATKSKQVTEITPVSVLQKGFRLKHNFKNTTSIGKAKQILFSENQKMLKELQRDIGFSYIKFHGILDDDMMVYSENSNGEPILNFSFIDMAIDFLLSIDLRPFMQLTFMPKALAKDYNHTIFFTESIVSLPKSMEKWNYLIKNLVYHLEDRYSKKEVETWPFSLWNEPDSPYEMFGLGSIKEYFEFYHETYKTVKSCNPNITFGSPSFMNDTLVNGTWINEYLELCKQHDCVPEFLNFHFYPINLELLNSNEDLQSFQSYTHIRYAESEDALKEAIYKINQNAKQYDWNIETLYLTEWNSSISHRDLLNDTAFKAPYIVKNILENYDRLESFGYWSLSDFLEEVKMADGLFHGGLGLITYNGIKKSAYYAFCLLARLGNRMIGKGEGYFITRDRESYQIILYNYQHYSTLYASGELFDMTFTNRYTPFPKETHKKFVIPLTDLPNNDYILRETIVNKYHGSSFDKWVELGALPLETTGEVEYLKSVSIPCIKKRALSVENNLLTITCDLEPHEVRLIEIYAKYHD